MDGRPNRGNKAAVSNFFFIVSCSFQFLLHSEDGDLIVVSSFLAGAELGREETM